MERTPPPGGGLRSRQDARRLEAVAEAEMAALRHGRALEQLTTLASEVLGVPVALVSLVEEGQQVFVGQHGLGQPWAARGQTGLSHSFCRLVVEDQAPLIVTDAREDPRTRENLAIEDLGVIAYAGVPLRDPSGLILGSVCAIDSKPRTWTARELELLDGFNAVVAGLLADRVEMSTQSRGEQVLSGEFEILSGRLQRALLPQLDDELASRVTASYQPGGDRLLLGGDFADVFSHPDGSIGFVLGDVCGHGPESAAMALTLRGSWAALEPLGLPLTDLVAQLNKIALREQRTQRTVFSTLIIGRARADAPWSLLRAGHPHPIDVGTQSEVVLPAGPPIGIGTDERWKTAEVPVSPAGLLLYTDGLTEGRAAPGTSERFGTARLLARIAEHRALPREQLLWRLVRDATQAHGDELPDDVALLLITP